MNLLVFSDEKLIVGGVVLMSFLVIFILFFITLYLRRFYEHQKEKQAMISLFNEEVLKTQLEIQEQTLNHISEEVHDNIGQALSFIKLSIGTVDLDQRLAAEEQLNYAMEHMTKVIQDLRDLVKTLNSDFISETGLKKAIGQQLEILAKSGRFQVAFTEEGKYEAFEPQKELVLFRMVQELLNNIVKHSGGSCVAIHMEHSAERLKIRVDDDGIGFDERVLSVGSSADKKGIGLKNISNRVRMIGGDIIFLNRPRNGGASVIITCNK